MEAAQEYFSEITNESTNESKGKAVASRRQTSKKTEYDGVLCKFILLAHLLNRELKFDSTDRPEAQSPIQRLLHSQRQ